MLLPKQKTHFMSVVLVFVLMLSVNLNLQAQACACPTCPPPPATPAVVISNCPVEDGTHPDQSGQDGAADGTDANPFATWRGALAFAQANNINHIVFEAGTYMTDNSVFNAFSLANGGQIITLAGMYVDGSGATIINTSTSAAGFAHINADNVTIANINLVNFGQAITIIDDQAFTMCNSIIDGSDIDGVNGAFINSDARNTDATFIGVQFNNHDTPNFTSAMDIFASSVTEAINTTVLFCDVDWNCNERDGFGGALFIGHGGGRGNPAWAGPIVCMQNGGFYGNIGLGIASDGGGLNVQDNATLTIDGTEFVCNVSNADDGTSGGGAMRIQSGAAATITNANFSGNTTTQYGGAILYTVDNTTDPALNISNTVFWSNMANRGGGLYSGSETTTVVMDSYFENNTANGTAFSNGGGAIYVDAGVQGTSTPTPTDFTLTNSTLSNNTSDDVEAGGMHIFEASTTEDDDDVTEDDHIIINNSVLCNNTSNNAGQADLSEDAYEGFLNDGFSSIAIDANSVIGAGMADDGVTNAGDRNLSQGDCTAIPAGVGFQGTPAGFLECPDCIATPSTTSSCPPVPVELIGFEAKVIDEEVFLTWMTASELNNDYFQVERSFDDKTFETIGLVKGGGTTMTIQAYEFIDYVPKTAVNYYRLKQVDFDGSYSYTETVVVNVDAKTLTSEVYPNPTTERLNIITSKAIFQAQVLDVTGRLLQTHAFSYVTAAQLDLAELPAGTYFVELTSNVGVEVIQFVKK